MPLNEIVIQQPSPMCHSKKQTEERFFQFNNESLDPWCNSLINIALNFVSVGGGGNGIRC